MSKEMKMVFGQISDQDVLNSLIDRKDWISDGYDDTGKDISFDYVKTEPRYSSWLDFFGEC